MTDEKKATAGLKHAFPHFELRTKMELPAVGDKSPFFSDSRHPGREMPITTTTSPIAHTLCTPRLLEPSTMTLDEKMPRIGSADLVNGTHNITPWITGYRPFDFKQEWKESVSALEFRAGVAIDLVLLQISGSGYNTRERPDAKALTMRQKLVHSWITHYMVPYCCMYWFVANGRCAQSIEHPDQFAFVYNYVTDCNPVDVGEVPPKPNASPTKKDWIQHAQQTLDRAGAGMQMMTFVSRFLFFILMSLRERFQGDNCILPQSAKGMWRWIVDKKLTRGGLWNKRSDERFCTAMFTLNPLDDKSLQLLCSSLSEKKKKQIRLCTMRTYGQNLETKFTQKIVDPKSTDGRARLPLILTHAFAASLLSNWLDGSKWTLLLKRCVQRVTGAWTKDCVDMITERDHLRQLFAFASSSKETTALATANEAEVKSVRFLDGPYPAAVPDRTNLDRWFSRAKVFATLVPRVAFMLKLVSPQFSKRHHYLLHQTPYEPSEWLDVSSVQIRENTDKSWTLRRYLVASLIHLGLVHSSPSLYEGLVENDRCFKQRLVMIPDPVSTKAAGEYLLARSNPCDVWWGMSPDGYKSEIMSNTHPPPERCIIVMQTDMAFPRMWISHTCKYLREGYVECELAASKQKIWVRKGYQLSHAEVVIIDHKEILQQPQSLFEHFERMCIFCADAVDAHRQVMRHRKITDFLEYCIRFRQSYLEFRSRVLRPPSRSVSTAATATDTKAAPIDEDTELNDVRKEYLNQACGPFGGYFDPLAPVDALSKTIEDFRSELIRQLTVNRISLESIPPSVVRTPKVSKLAKDIKEMLGVNAPMWIYAFVLRVLEWNPPAPTQTYRTVRSEFGPNNPYSENGTRKRRRL